MITTLVVALAGEDARADDGAPSEPPPTETKPDGSAAQALFDAGRALMEEGKPALACAKFEESEKLDPSAGTLLNWGKCLEAQGKTASAWAMYKQAVSLGKSTGKERHVEAAEQFIAAIEPRLVKLVVDAKNAPPDLAVDRKDASGATAAIAREALGLAIAVDPASYTIEAHAAGRAPWSTTIDLEKEGETSTVTIPELALAETPKPPPAKKTISRPLVIAGGVTAGVGVVGLAIGTAFGALTLSDASDAESDPKLCPHFACTPAGEAVVHDAESESYASTASLTIGALATAAGTSMIVWAVLHPKSEPAAGAVSIVPVVPVGGPPGAPRVLGVVVGGSL